jgi:DHA2 family multidrug resistance protein-like MFS transporter
VPGSIGAAVYRAQVGWALPAGIPGGAAEAARETLGGAAAAAAGLPDQLGAALLEVAQGAFVSGLHASVGIGAVVVAALAAFVALSLREVPADGAPAAEPARPADAAVVVELAA